MRRVRALEVSAVATLLAVALSFAGWGRSGQSVRSSYGLFQAAGRAGLLPDSVEQIGLVFFFVPALAGAAVICHAVDRRRWAASGYLVAALMLCTAVMLVVASPLIVELPAVLAGVTSAVAATTALWASWRDRARRNR